jgi:hypothetical protein
MQPFFAHFFLARFLAIRRALASISLPSCTPKSVNT